MNNDHHNGHFFDGFLLGIVVGAAAVFLLGTKTGKNLLKILSEQGVDGLKDLMDEYNLDADEEEFEEESPEVIQDLKHEAKEAQSTATEIKEEAKEEVKQAAPKKRFFKRLRS